MGGVGAMFAFPSGASDPATLISCEVRAAGVKDAGPPGASTALTERGGQPAVSVTGEAALRGTTPYCVR